MTLLAALLPLLAMAGPGATRPAAPVARSVQLAIRAPSPAGAPTSAVVARALVQSGRDSLASAFTAPPGEPQDLTVTDCRAGACAAGGPDLGPLGATRVNRRDLLLALLARTPFGPLSSAANAIASLPLQVDYSPRDGSRDRRGWGRVSVGLRWRFDGPGAASREAEAPPTAPPPSPVLPLFPRR